MQVLFSKDVIKLSLSHTDSSPLNFSNSLAEMKNRGRPMTLERISKDVLSESLRIRPMASTPSTTKRKLINVRFMRYKIVFEGKYKKVFNNLKIFLTKIYKNRIIWAENTTRGRKC